MASSFRRAIIVTGKRTEIVRTEGFRLGRATRFAFVQSMCSVESAFPQKSLSSLSELKAGRGFRAFLLIVGFIKSPLFAGHLPRRNNPDQIPPHGKGYKQQPGLARATESVISSLTLRMLRVVPNDKWLIEENLFALEIRYGMLLPILIGISFIPLEPGAF